MSWGVNVKGNSDAVANVFDMEYEGQKAYGAPGAELADIETAKLLAVAAVEHLGEIKVSAGGSWFLRDEPVRDSFFVNLSAEVLLAVV